MEIASITTVGSGPLVMASVLPFPRENLSVRSTMVKVVDEDAITIETGSRLRTQHLISAKSTSAITYRAAAMDVNGIWSEWSDAVSLTTSNFVRGNTIGSIGSGASSDLSLEEPAINFPQLNHGSGRVYIHRTLVSDGYFYGETRRSKWDGARASFNVSLTDLDEDQAMMMHRFYRALNGPLTPFYFDWTDPTSGNDERYVVRFRDPSLVADLFIVDRSHMEFTLVELIGRSAGGNV